MPSRLQQRRDDCWSQPTVARAVGNGTAWENAREASLAYCHCDSAERAIYIYYSLEKVTSGSEDHHARSGMMIWVLNIWFWTGGK